MTRTRGLTIGAAAVALLSLAARHPALAAEPKPQQMVDALHTTFGDHHSRAVHAKGIILEGTFTPDPGVRAFSKAKAFAGGAIPVVARFSDFTGIPDIPDNVGDANPRGFAFKLKVPDDTELDVVAHSFNGFPAKTSAEFRELLLAIAASGKDAPKPTALDKFFAAHPIAKTFLTTQKTPASYATSAYYGVNAFKFSDAKGHALFVRYRFAPASGESYLDPEALKSKSADFLQAEVKDRIAKGPIGFDWYAQIAAKGDRADDPSIAWPQNRRMVKLGTITLTAIAADQPSEDRKLLFLPANLPDGIEAADPMLAVRNGAYPISFRHRQ